MVNNNHDAFALFLTRQVTELVLLALIFVALPLARATTDPSDGTLFVFTVIGLLLLRICYYCFFFFFLRF
jgi:hypothetical protein